MAQRHDQWWAVNEPDNNCPRGEPVSAVLGPQLARESEVMQSGMSFRLYQQRGGHYYLAMVLLVGSAMSLWAAKISLILTVSIVAYWAYRAVYVLLNPIVQVSEKASEIIIYRTAFGFVFNRKSRLVSNYYGIRNRVHWGHYKHCQTELVGNAGEYLPIRIELMAEKISDDAVTFKAQLARALNLEHRPDIGCT